MHEFELIKNYFSKLSNKSKSSLNLNDDVFFDKNCKLVVSVDTYVEGNHFFNFKKPDLVIKKIIRSSISDLICKGVKPKYYFLSGSGNKKFFLGTDSAPHHLKHKTSGLSSKPGIFSSPCSIELYADIFPISAILIYLQ